MRRVVGLGGRLLHGAAVVLLGLSALACVGAALLALRLAQGPMDVAWAVRIALRLAGAGQVRIGAATLGWGGWQDGAESPVRLVVRRLNVNAADGAPRLTAQEGNATLSMSGLLKGEVSPRTATLLGAHLRMRHDAAGVWHLELGDAVPSGDGGGPPDGLDQLRRLALQDATVEVDDARLGPWRLTGVAADLTRDDDGGLHGTASADAALAGIATHLAVQATVQPGGASRITVSATPVDPSAVAAIVPALAAAAAFQAPVALSGTLDLGSGLQPVRATATASAGPGRLQVAGGTVAFDSLVASVELGWTAGVPDRVPDRVPGLRLDALLRSPGGGPGTRLAVQGSGERQRDRAAARLTAELDQVRIDDLPQLWPPDLAPDARSWITQNITAGTLRNARFAFGLDTPADLSDVQLIAASGAMRSEGASVHWLRPVPAVDGVTATVTLVDPDVIAIVVDPGGPRPVEPTPAGPLTLGGGSVRLSGLAGKDQTAAIDLEIGGSFPATVALLRHPRLKLLSRHPPPFRSSEGRSAVHLNLKLPLKKDVDFEDVPLRVDARLTRLRLNAVVAGRDLTDGDVALTVTNDGLDVKGRATVAGLPGQVEARIAFDAGPPDQVVQSVTFATRPAPAQLAAAGAPVGGILSGTPAVKVSYLSRRNGAGEVGAVADLLAAGIEVPGWRKSPGVPARVEAHAVLARDRLVAVDVLRAEGPGLRVEGRAELAASGQPPVLVVEDAEIGATRASGRVTFGTTLTVSATGPVLDLSSLPKRSAGSHGSTPSRPRSAFVADFAFGQVLLGPGRVLTGVTAHADSDGHVVRHASVTAEGPTRVSVLVAPEGTGRTLVARAADLGPLLRVLDVTDRIATGPGTIVGRFDDTRPESPLVGFLGVDRVHVLGAPSVGKILQAVTIYGIADALRGPGLVFSRLEAPFRYAGDRLELMESRLVSASLGATATGTVDFGRRLVDITGTVVPFYVLNAAPGRIPLVGRLFTAEADSGLFAATYAVRGVLDDPSVRINPFTLLAPGLLRRLFEPRR